MLLSLFTSLILLSCTSLTSEPETESTKKHAPILIESEMKYDSVVFSSFSIPLVVEDLDDGDYIDFASCDSKLKAFFGPSPSSVTFTISEKDIGDHSFSLVVYDKDGLSDTMQISFRVEVAQYGDFAPLAEGNLWEYFIETFSERPWSQSFSESQYSISVDSIRDDIAYITSYDTVTTTERSWIGDDTLTTITNDVTIETFERSIADEDVSVKRYALSFLSKHRYNTLELSGYESNYDRFHLSEVERFGRYTSYLDAYFIRDIGLVKAESSSNEDDSKMVVTLKKFNSEAFVYNPNN